MTKNESKIISFEKSMVGLEKSIKKYEEDNEDKIYFRDSAIQRFEMTFDLAWKTLKENLLNQKGLVCNSPKDCFRQAFENKFFIKDSPLWMDMTDNRNLMSHSYDEDDAEKVYEKLPEYLVLFKELLNELKK